MTKSDLVKTCLLAFPIFIGTSFASANDGQRFECSGTNYSGQSVSVIADQSSDAVTVDGEIYRNCLNNGEYDSIYDQKDYEGCNGQSVGTRTDLHIYNASATGPYSAVIKTSKYVDPSGMNRGFNLTCVQKK
jgi:hypothetical protein